MLRGAVKAGRGQEGSGGLAPPGSASCSAGGMWRGEGTEPAACQAVLSLQSLWRSTLPPDCSREVPTASHRGVVRTDSRAWKGLEGLALPDYQDAGGTEELVIPLT